MSVQIEVDIESEVPIFSQLVDQIKTAIAVGGLKPGMALPPIRALAKELGINPNTVSKSYKLLERDKLIVSKGYRGTYVHDQALENCENDRERKVLEVIATAIKEMRHLGATDSEIRLAFASAMRNGVENDPV
jgi:GntR family transcriptional regulator